MSKTHTHLQTYSLELKIVQKTLKNCDKELVIVKGQMNRVQHENQNLSNKLKEANKLLGKLKTYSKSMLSLTSSIGKPTMI
jgi:uncharacterized protein YoxC